MYRAVAVVAAILAAATVVGACGWDSGSTLTPATEPSVRDTTRATDGDYDSLPPPRPGWRYESYHDVVVEVPESWEYGHAPTGAWCIATTLPTEPYVDTARPYDVVEAIGCPGVDEPKNPEDLTGVGVPRRHWTTHVTFAAPGDRDGTARAGEWTRTNKTVGTTQITVLAEERHGELAQAILDSARRVPTDHNGCNAASPIQAGDFVRPSAIFDVASVDTVDEISICQYDLARGEGMAGLIGSRRLTEADAAELLGAVKETPVGGGPDEPQNCSDDLYGDTAVVLRLHHDGTTDDMYVYYEWCFGNGFDDGTNLRELTRANCIPLFAPPVKYDGGSSAPFQRCHEDVDGGAESAPDPAPTTSTSE